MQIMITATLMRYYFFYRLAWEDTLRDNLLNFASTAKGILLLQQTGAINECMSYMYARYAKKLQVSILQGRKLMKKCSWYVISRLNN